MYLTHRSRWERYPAIMRGPRTKSSHSMSATADRCPIDAYSVTPITATPTVSQSMRAVGFGRRRQTACTSGPPIAASSALFPPLRSRRTALSGAQTDDGCSSPQRNICWRLTSSDKLEKMPIRIANERIAVRSPNDACRCSCFDFGVNEIYELPD